MNTGKKLTKRLVESIESPHQTRRKKIGLHGAITAEWVRDETKKI